MYSDLVVRVANVYTLHRRCSSDVVSVVVGCTPSCREELDTENTMHLSRSCVWMQCYLDRISA